MRSGEWGMRNEESGNILTFIGLTHSLKNGADLAVLESRRDYLPVVNPVSRGFFSPVGTTQHAECVSPILVEIWPINVKLIHQTYLYANATCATARGASCVCECHLRDRARRIMYMRMPPARPREAHHDMRMPPARPREAHHVYANATCTTARGAS
jgi:hypothetical protein